MVRGVLSDGELALWDRMSLADRKHAAGVANALEARRPLGAGPEVTVAALLHDVGKIDAGLGTFGRALATLAAAALGPERVAGWQNRRGLARRVGAYLDHPERGAALLRSAGSHAFVVTWAAEHHQDQRSWTIERSIAEVLKAVDDD